MPLKLKDIAKALGLSVTTISKVINNYPDISQTTKKKVLEYVKQNKYKPNLQASFLRTNESKLVGIILPSLNHYFFNSVLEGLVDNAMKNNYMVIVLQSNEKYKKEKKLVEKLLNLNVDGIFISVSQETRNFDHLFEIQKNNKTLILFDKIEKSINCSKVIINDKQAGFIATEHLIKRGCKKILHFRGGLLPQISIDRFLGYRSALEHYKIPYDPKRVFICENGNDDEGYLNAKKVIEEGIEFDGLFAISDLIALGAIRYFNKKNISIPDQVAVVGFSNWKVSKLTTPTLTTINQPGKLMGEKMFDLFLKGFKANKNKEKINFETIIIPSNLIVRNSS